ncbi:hypothetical protein KJ877_05515 [bacterium]|nr:hypothetical protein [bacterium]MBU1990490.1 hypothetical protein [bacterium]
MSEILQTSVKTKNIKETMQTFASDNFTPLAECDFTIDEVSIYIRSSANTDFTVFQGDIKEEFDTDEKLLNRHVEFHQVYSITATKRKTCDIKLSYSIDFGEYSTNPKIIINPGSHIPYKLFKPKELFQILLQEINKIKAENGILIHIFDASMIKNLKILTKYIYAGSFTKKVRIPLFEGIEPEISRASKLIMWFEHKDAHQQVIEVEEGEVLVEFKKPIFGKNGFNAFGLQIDNNYGTNLNDLQADIDYESIKIEENSDKKLYKSKRKGYVNFDGTYLTVNNKVKMSKLSRVQDSVAKEQDNNIEVHISQNDTTKDSIGEGVELTSETILVNGHIGANSILEAVNLQVEGATHKDSTQFARFAKINRHKGTLRCHEAKIALLEGGEVHATNVHIEASLGGVVRAQNVTIGHVKSNLKVYASHSITLRLVSGEDNLFKINYKEVPILNSKIDLINEDIQELKYSLEEAKRHNVSQVPLIKEKIKRFQNEKKSIIHSTEGAKVTIEKPLHGLNKIIFTIDDDHELIFKTDATTYDPFYIEMQEDKIILHPVNTSLPLHS